MKEKYWSYIVLSPIIAYLIIFWFWPFIFNIYISFFDWNIVTPIYKARFTGLENYYYLFFEDDIFWTSMYNMLLYSLGVPIIIVLSLVIALLLKRVTRLGTFFRLSIYSPYVTAVVALALIWKNGIYHPLYGILNDILRRFGLPTQPWLTSPSLALPSMLILIIWRYLGYLAILFLAGLEGIPESYYHAAKVDGASSFQQFLHITLPLLKPVTLLVLIITTIGALQIFTEPYVMTMGGPVNSTMSIVLYMYITAFQYMKMSRAAAMATILFGVILVLTLLEIKVVRGGMEYYR